MKFWLITFLIIAVIVVGGSLAAMALGVTYDHLAICFLLGAYATNLARDICAK